MVPGRVYTIGYGNRDADALWAALREVDVGILIDVRSAPYSRFRPEFSKKPLAEAAQVRGLEYRFLGDRLGARPDDPGCYVDGQVVYERVAERPAFHHGIDQVAAIAARARIPCLLCAENDPARCHRALLVAPALVEAGLQVVHLLADGTQIDQQTLVRRARTAQLTLFGER